MFTCILCLCSVIESIDNDCSHNDFDNPDLKYDGDNNFDLRVVLARSRVDWEALVMLHTAYIGFMILRINMMMVMILRINMMMVVMMMTSRVMIDG